MDNKADAFHSALQGKAVIMNEYFLVGSVLDAHKDGFLEILRGLCDNPENRPIEFTENEYIFSAGRYVTLHKHLQVSTLIRITLILVNPNGANVSLRSRCVRPSSPGDHCHLRYLGHTDLKIDKEKKAMVRTYIDCLTSSNLNDYLKALGFKFVSFISS